MRGRHAEVPAGSRTGAGLAEVAVSDVNETAAGITVDVDVTAVGEDDSKGWYPKESISISRELESSMPLDSPFFTGEYRTRLLGLTSSSKSLHS